MANDVLLNVKQKTVYVPQLQVLSADGAITINAGIVVITKSTAAAITLAAPVSGTDDGKILEIFSATAAAHTVTNAAPGFNNPASAATSDVGTFGGAKGDGFECIAYQGAWYAVHSRNVTFA